MSEQKLRDDTNAVLEITKREIEKKYRSELERLKSAVINLKQ